jgi:N-terminal acetyltransferase B complex catalytic subunit
MAQWPDYFKLAKCPHMMSYGTYIPDLVMGKAEGDKELWHGHVTALTVSQEYRRMGLAKKMMTILEEGNFTNINI